MGVGVELVDVRLGVLEVEVVEVNETEVDEAEVRVERVADVFAEVESAVERLEIVLTEGEVVADTVVLFTEEIVPVDVVERMVAVLKVVVVIVGAAVEVEVDVLTREYN